MVQLALFNQTSHSYENSSSGLTFVDTQNMPAATLPHGGKIISLFSGAGGLDIGLEACGYKTVLCVDSDRDCRATLHHNRPEWTVWGGLQGDVDVRELTAEAALEAAGCMRGQLALVVGGAPCQPFSHLGNQEGAEDARNGDLFREFVRLVRELEPAGFIFENVAAITHAKHEAVLRYMLTAFEQAGYAVTHGLLNAADYGVPQRRERFFMVGRRDGVKPPMPLPTHHQSAASWTKFSDALDHPPLHTPAPWQTTRDALMRLPSDYRLRPDYAVMSVSAVVLERMKLIGPGENFKVLPDELRPDCWRSGKHTGSDTFGRLRSDEPSVTIRTSAYNPSKGRYIHPWEHRGLDTIEMAALQGFPYAWRFRSHRQEKTPMSSAGKQIGNAVPPPLAAALGAAIFMKK